MSIYDHLWLTRFLNPINQPKEIRSFLKEESEILLNHIKIGSSLIDFGCGYGRHLELLSDRLSYGLGIDISKGNITLGKRRLRHYTNIELKVADCRSPNLEQIFDYAIIMNNTLGNMEEKKKVVSEMENAIHQKGQCIFSVYNPESVSPRIDWYQRTGLKVKTVSSNYIETEDGFRSYHFTKDQLLKLIGRCNIIPIGRIGYFAISH